MTPDRPLVAVDFDGTVVEYLPWDRPDAIGGLLPGAVAAMNRLREAGYDVVVFTTRDNAAVRRWLRQRNLLPAVVLRVTNRKPPAAAFFDDHAVHVLSNTPHSLESAVITWLETDAMQDTATWRAAMDAGHIAQTTAHFSRTHAKRWVGKAAREVWFGTGMTLATIGGISYLLLVLFGYNWLSLSWEVSPHPLVTILLGLALLQLYPYQRGA